MGTIYIAPGDPVYYIGKTLEVVCNDSVEVRIFEDREKGGRKVIYKTRLGKTFIPSDVGKSVFMMRKHAYAKRDKMLEDFGGKEKFQDFLKLIDEVVKANKI